MREIVDGHGDHEIRLNHLLSDDLKNTHSAGCQTPGPWLCVCVGAGVGHMLVYEAAPDSIYKKNENQNERLRGPSAKTAAVSVRVNTHIYKHTYPSEWSSTIVACYMRG